jgi:hypothetical protein
MREVGRRPPTGRHGHGPVNGLRVGALAGGLFGAAGALLAGAGVGWFLLVGGALGGAIGYWSEKRKAQGSG